MSVLCYQASCLDSLFLSCGKALGLSWTIQEETLRSRIETQVCRLRGRDRRFAVKKTEAKSFSQDAIGKCIENLDRILCALDSDNLITVRTACEELVVHLINLDGNGIVACKLLPIFVLTRTDQLAEASCLLKKALMDFPADPKLWIARGEIFLRMGAPALADVHFKQPCTKDHIHDSLLIQCKARLLDNSFTFSSLSKIAPQELYHRGEVLRDEIFMKSAAYHFAAGFKYGTEDIQKQCFLNLIQSVYLLNDAEAWAHFAINAIDWAMQHYSSMYLKLSKERAHWLFTYRDYVHAADELLHLKELKKGILTHDEDYLLKHIEKILRSNVYCRVFPNRYRIGKVFGSGVSVNRVRVDESFMIAGKKVILWIYGPIAIPLDLASKESAVCLGKFVGSLPDHLDIPTASCMAVHDFRKCSWFKSHRSRRLFRKYDSQNYLHFVCTNDVLVVYPLHPTIEEGNNAMQDIQITWPDIRQTIIQITNSNVESPKSNILTECLVQGIECRRSILQQKPHEDSLCECSNISAVWSAVDTFETLQNPVLGVNLPKPAPDVGDPLIMSKSRYPNHAAALVGGVLIIMLAMMLSPMNL